MKLFAVIGATGLAASHNSPWPSWRRVPHQRKSCSGRRIIGSLNGTRRYGAASGGCMGAGYEIVLTEPADTLVAHMNTIGRGPAVQSPQPFFDATLALERRRWTARNLTGVLLRHPWTTAKVQSVQSANLYGEPWKPAPALALGHPATDEALQVGV